MITSLDQLDLTKIYTYQDYLNWDLKERVELILGKIFRMSPAPSMRHQQISMNLTREWLKVLDETSCQLFAAPFDVRLSLENSEKRQDTVVQPDLCVICDPAKIDERGCKGAPDLVIEILSPGNTQKEMKEKFEVYEAAGVPEYWMVDPIREDVLVYSLNEQQKYIGSKPFITGEQIVSMQFQSILLATDRVFRK